MNVSSFEFESVDGKKIYVKKWMPETTAKGVLQISHGMAEHVERYNEFAEYLTNNGFIVYANDHRGHGQTAEPDKLGFFTSKNGWKLVIDDVRKLSEIIKEQNPDLPLFLLGHSMGSLIARANVMMCKPIIDGVIFSGTSAAGGAIVGVGKMISSFQGLFKGKTKPSKLMTGMTFKGYNDPFKPTKTPFDWLSSDYDRNKNYWDDKFCGFVCPNRFFFDLLSVIQYINKPQNIKNIPVDLPIYFYSGAMDPVGQFGKDVPIIYNKYKDLGVKDIKIKLYDGGRHEMLNETNRQEVYADVLEWLNQHLPQN